MMGCCLLVVAWSQFYTKLATAMENHDSVITRIEDLREVKRLPSRKGGTVKTIEKVGVGATQSMNVWVGVNVMCRWVYMRCRELGVHVVWAWVCM
jgi:hypothetical protein